MLLTLFQQSYKGFKKNFFKIRSNLWDPALLDGFPLYWIEKPILQRARSLEDLAPQERGVCELLYGLHAPFGTLELLKCEFNPKSLKTNIGIFLLPCLLLHFILACILALLIISCVNLLLLCRYGLQQRQEEEAGRSSGQAKGGCCWGGPFNAPQPQLLLLSIQLSLPLLLIGKLGWWLSNLTTKTPAPALSSKGKGLTRPWHPRLLHLVRPRPSWTTPLVPPPRFKWLFTRVGERVPPKAKRCPPPPSFPCCSNDYSIASKTRRWWKA